MMRKFLTLLAGFLGTVIWVMSAKAQQRKAESKVLKRDNELAQQVIKQEQRQQHELTELQKKHREEQRNAQEDINKGDRSQFDNNW
ncbi:MAG: hypothetical protein JKY50_09450 [Oleispira sp.]|nr:hypothetical protein [Oleispira sp.]